LFEFADPAHLGLIRPDPHSFGLIWKGALFSPRSPLPAFDGVKMLRHVIMLKRRATQEASGRQS
jgi:hypothetical protein